MTKISEYAFAYMGLKGVLIPNSVVNIDKNAFIYNEFISITIPSSVTTIGNKAFEHNTNSYPLKKLVIKGNATNLPNRFTNKLPDIGLNDAQEIEYINE